MGGTVRSTKILVAAATRAAAAAVPLPTATATFGASGATPADAAGAARARTMSAEQAKATGTARALHLDARESLRVTDAVRDADGTTHVRYDRTFAGLRVLGGDLVVHQSPSGAVLRTDRAGSGTVDVTSTGAAVTRRAATDTALSRAGSASATAGAELVVYAAGTTPRLAY